MSALSGAGPEMLRYWRNGIDALILAAISVFLLQHFRPILLLSSTHATGGDTPSHFYTLMYLKQMLLPHGRVTGWTPANYAGFPILENYFPFPFLIMVALSWFMPLTVAFKIGTVVGIFLLPVGAYVGLRAIRIEFPGPAMGAAISLLFLFLESNSLWGGNILSTLAGEFAYSLSLALTLVWLGTFYRGIFSNKHVLLNGVLLALIGFSHGYPLLFLVVFSSFFLFDWPNFNRNFIYLSKMYTLAFLLMAFWLVPLLGHLPWTTAFDYSWPYQSWTIIFPIILWPALFCAFLAIFRTPRRPFLYLLGANATGWMLYAMGPRLGVVDIRFLPFAQVTTCLMAALGLSWAVARLKGQGLIACIVLLACLGWADKNTTQMDPWIKWNYSGFEAKPLWPAYSRVNDLLKGSEQDPRVIYEHAARHNEAGSVRAWESLPVFSGRSTLEHAYFQASPSAPFVFYLQSEVSKEQSCPFADYGCTTTDLERAVPHLRLFNVKELVVISDQVKTALMLNPHYKLVENVDPYAIYELTGPHHYVEPLLNEPVLWTGGQWKQTAYTWFRNSALSDITLVFPTSSHKEETAAFPLQTNSLTNVPRHPLPPAEPVLSEHLGNDELTFEVRTLHRPYLIKMSYHPDWKVEGADRIYLASPSFMIVYPSQSRVRLYFARSSCEYLGLVMTLLGLCLAVGLWKFTRMQNIVLPNTPVLVGFKVGILSLEALLWLSLIPGTIRQRISDPNVLIAKGIKLRDQKQWDASERYFERVIDRNPISGLAEHAQYYLATDKILRQDWQGGIAAFNRLIERFPDGRYSAEAYFHIALCYDELHKVLERNQAISDLIKKFPLTNWARFAHDRWHL